MNPYLPVGICRLYSIFMIILVAFLSFFYEFPSLFPGVIIALLIIGMVVVGEIFKKRIDQDQQRWKEQVEMLKIIKDQTEQIKVILKEREEK